MSEGREKVERERKRELLRDGTGRFILKLNIHTCDRFKRISSLFSHSMNVCMRAYMLVNISSKGWVNYLCGS